MRAFLIGAAACAMTTAAFAGPADYAGPQASLYMSYSFDRPAPRLDAPAGAALRYGFQLDHDWRRHFDAQQPPMLRWEFSSFRFDNLSVAGKPLLSREMVLQADEDGGIFDFVKNNAGPLAFGIGAAILAVAIVDGDKDARNRDVSDPDGIGTTDSGNIDNQSPSNADGLPGSNESPGSAGEPGSPGTLPGLPLPL